MGASRVVAIGPKTWNANVTAVDGDAVTLGDLDLRREFMKDVGWRGLSK